MGPALHAETVITDPKTSFTLIEQRNDLGEQTACGVEFIVYTDYSGVQGRMVVNRFQRLQFDFGVGQVDEFGEYSNVPLKGGILQPAGFDGGEKLPLTFSWDQQKQEPVYDQPRLKAWRSEMIQALLYSGFTLTYSTLENPDKPVKFENVVGDFEIGKKYNECQSAMAKNVQDIYKSKHGGSTECLDNPDACLKKE
ncbi:MAG: hypothetical protein EB060_10140 [Proteobacteria bacterium]|nr:hypothetical protein [Pseudomonadota bacterium]